MSERKLLKAGISNEVIHTLKQHNLTNFKVSLNEKHFFSFLQI